MEAFPDLQTWKPFLLKMGTFQPAAGFQLIEPSSPIISSARYRSAQLRYRREAAELPVLVMISGDSGV
jgi:hypothetical protein